MSLCRRFIRHVYLGTIVIMMVDNLVHSHTNDDSVNTLARWCINCSDLVCRFLMP